MIEQSVELRVMIADEVEYGLRSSYVTEFLTWILQWWIQGAPWRAPMDQNFHAVFWKNWQNRMLVPPPPGELALPPRGNPGSATVLLCY